MESEWALCWAIAEGNCKNYQLWNHRRRCAMHMGADNAARELEFAAHFLEQDAKNYHIWAHRQARPGPTRCCDWHSENTRQDTHATCSSQRCNGPDTPPESTAASGLYVSALAAAGHQQAACRRTPRQ